MSATTRPTSDKVREAVFNILTDKEKNILPFGSVLDIFAGTGALGLEAISRDVDKCVFIDKAVGAIKNIKANVELLCKDLDGLDIKIMKDDALRAIGKLDKSFDLVFIDAPYNELELTEKVLVKLKDKKVLNEDAVVVVEVSSKDDLKYSEDYELINEKVYGDTKVVFLGERQ